LYTGFLAINWFIGAQLPTGWKYQALVVIIPEVLLPLFHGMYLFGLGARHSIDRMIARHYEDRLHDILDAQFGEDLKNQLNESTKDWSRWVQLCVSCTLAFLAALVAVLIAAG